MARALNKLTDKGASATKKPGRYSDGGGLYLNVASSGTKSWVFMWTPKGSKRREMGLGAYPTVSLAKARALAGAYRVDVAEGRDPIAERDVTPEPTFGVAADEFIDSIKSEWKNAKHAEQWRHSIEVRCAKIRPLRVSQVTTEDILGVLRQSVTVKYKGTERTGEFWHIMPETAGRVRNRIERVLNYAKTKGWRSGENPAAWHGHLQNILPRRPRLIRGHQKALAYEDVPAFIGKLRGMDTLPARAAEITILAMVRSGETLGMQWPEIDLERRLWTIPAERMKMKKEHEVPLCDRAVEILTALKETRNAETFVFPGEPRKGKNELKPLSSMAMLMTLRRMGYTNITMHGFRSAARDWAGDTTSFPREVIEHALAHKAGTDVEVAYRRSTALAKRRKLMEAWANYCADTAGGKVVQMQGLARNAG